MAARDTPPSALVGALHEPRCYPHPVDRVALLETHISWVLLTGTYAYKVKKPLDLGFLDFSSLDARKRACAEELRLNRRTAPEIYLAVVPITGTPAEPSVDGAGSAIEYAVKMHEFSQDALLTALAARGALTLAHMDELAATVARFHGSIDCVGRDSEFGTPDEVIRQARANFDQVRALANDAAISAAIAHLAGWTEREFARRYDVFEARHRGGFVRECHGDLHLRNLVLRDEGIAPFDCIEFNASLRWIDVMNEVAFLVMDLADHGLVAHAWHFLDAYLAQTGDYGGLALLHFYLVYRAMVRAKVRCMRANQLPVGTPERADADREWRAYLALAAAFAALARRALVITHGLSGSGKTVFAGLLVDELGAIRICSDRERKRLHGLAASARTAAGVGVGIYAHDTTARTYERLRELAHVVLAADLPVVVDATFLARAHRDALRGLARQAGVPFAIAHCEAPAAVLRARIEARAELGRDPSEATLDVLAQQSATAEPIADEERTFAVAIDTQGGIERFRARALSLGARLGIGPWRPGTANRAGA